MVGVTGIEPVTPTMSTQLVLGIGGNTRDRPRTKSPIQSYVRPHFMGETWATFRRAKLRPNGGQFMVSASKALPFLPFVNSSACPRSMPSKR